MTEVVCVAQGARLTYMVVLPRMVRPFSLVVTYHVPGRKLYGHSICPGVCDFDAQAEYEPHTVAECGGPWARQGDLA